MKRNFAYFFVLLAALFIVQTGLAQTLKMNEVYSRGVPADPDWIEIYNPTSTAVDLTGYKIYDNGGQAGTKPKKVFPSGAHIPGFGFYIIVTDDAAPDGSGFGISSSGETVWLENPASSIIDSVVIVAMPDTTTSYCRIPDGSTHFEIASVRTRGKSNVLVKMNEIYTRGIPTAPDWIELFNSHSAAIDISGYKIYDIGGQGGTKPKKPFPVGASIPANGFYVIVTDDAAPDGSGFGLSSSGETAWLENGSALVVDTCAIPALPDTNTSYGRYPDGGGVWQILPARTRGTGNILTGIDDAIRNPADYYLGQNYPNPFNPSTSITYSIPSQGYVTIRVFNILGREVGVIANGIKSAGTHTVRFDATGLGSGVYFYQLNAGTYTATKKFVVTK